ncbi:MAG: HNH endonuclease [Candidatus Aenigmarchaeota archaeon]|nr:HNH endonuclease [Candidatus Aenigmarchaeota archaeon]
MGIYKCGKCNKDFRPLGGWKEHCPSCNKEIKASKKKAELLKKEQRKYCNYVIFERDDFRCIYCGRSPIEDNIRLVVDHIIPKSKEGTHSIYNLVSSCWECNTSKNTLPLKEDVYCRIVGVIKERNKGISPEAAVLVESIFKQLLLKTESKR